MWVCAFATPDSLLLSLWRPTDNVRMLLCLTCEPLLSQLVCPFSLVDVLSFLVLSSYLLMTLYAIAVGCVSGLASTEFCKVGAGKFHEDFMELVPLCPLSLDQGVSFCCCPCDSFIFNNGWERKKTRPIPGTSISSREQMRGICPVLPPHHTPRY